MRINPDILAPFIGLSTLYGVNYQAALNGAALDHVAAYYSHKINQALRR